MSKINVLIVEDEAIVAKDIQVSLKKSGYNVVDIVSTGEAALKAILEHKPDLIMLDIMLKGLMSGVDVAEVIKNNYNIPVVFLTAYTDQSTIDKAKLTDPYGYIIKPFKDVDLHTTIEIALHKHSVVLNMLYEKELLSNIISNSISGNDDNVVFVKHNSKLIKLASNEIVFIEALKDYVIVNTLSNKYTLHTTMKDIEIKLSSASFLRVHRSFIIRIDKILTVESGNISFGEQFKLIPIGGSYRDLFVERIKQL